MGQRETEQSIQEILVEKGISRTLAGFIYLSYCLQAFMKKPHAKLGKIMEEMLAEREIKTDWKDCYRLCAYAVKKSSKEEVRTKTLNVFLCECMDAFNQKLLDQEKNK